MMRLFVATCAFLVIACSPDRAARADETNRQDAERIPVLAWGGPPAGQATVERFRELAECGFTDSFSGFANANDMAKALDAAKQAGVRLLVSCPELESSPEGTVKRFKDHPALGGYFLRDEPSVGDFPSLAKWAKRVEAIDSDHLVYINLFPDYANAQQLGVGTYQDYVDRFVKEVPIPTISFDYYPIVGHSVRASWYANLEVIAAAAWANHKPFWAFALSLPHYDYPTPTVAHLREQVYSDLAYGAQGIEYFTYWAAGGLGGGSPIDAGGKRTAVYDRVKQVNAELRALSPIFVGSKVLWVRHTGKSIPQGTRRFEPERPIQSLTTSGAGAVVSRMSKSDHQFLLIVNRDIEKPMPMKIDFSEGMAVSQIQKDGTERRLASLVYSADVEPGDAVLFAW
jgi:hypothetical protein